MRRWIQQGRGFSGSRESGSRISPGAEPKGTQILVKHNKQQINKLGFLVMRLRAKTKEVKQDEGRTGRGMEGVEKNP